MRAGWLGVLVAATIASIAATTAHSQDAAAIARQHLERGSLEEGERELVRLVETGNDEARLGLGTIQFVRATETLIQALYRYGLRAPRGAFIPVLRLPVPPNPRPAPLTYDGFRTILQTFAANLGKAETTLAEVRPDARLALDLALVRIDYDGDGMATENERLWTILSGIDPRLAARLRFTEIPDSFPVTFDAGDVAWARGYAHLLSGIAEFWLAHDFTAQFDQSFQVFFPNAGLPNPAPAAVGEMSGVADLLSFVHLLNWPVARPELLASSLDHFKAVPALSRASWAAIRAETDDDHEWLPSATQTNRFPSLPVTDERIDGWLRTMAQLDAILDGRKLVPHWRFMKGVNVRAAFLDHKHFDPILWVTGTGVTPFLQDGEVITANEWREIVAIFGGNFFGYAIRFN